MNTIFSNKSSHEEGKCEELMAICEYHAHNPLTLPGILAVLIASEASIASVVKARWLHGYFSALAGLWIEQSGF